MDLLPTVISHLFLTYRSFSSLVFNSIRNACSSFFPALIAHSLPTSDTDKDACSSTTTEKRQGDAPLTIASFPNDDDRVEVTVEVIYGNVLTHDANRLSVAEPGPFYEDD
jgi:hypothetical protein